MMPLSEIARVSMEWTIAAKKADKEPYVFFDESDVQPPWKFPALGNHVPKGWTLVDKLFCDMSGWGSENEPALTMKQQKEKFLEYVRKDGTHGFGLLEAGQFQCSVGVFRKVEHAKKTKTKKA